MRKCPSWLEASQQPLSAFLQIQNYIFQEHDSSPGFLQRPQPRVVPNDQNCQPVWEGGDDFGGHTLMPVVIGYLVADLHGAVVNIFQCLEVNLADDWTVDVTDSKVDKWW